MSVLVCVSASLRWIPVPVIGRRLYLVFLISYFLLRRVFRNDQETIGRYTAFIRNDLMRMIDDH